jgi:hypothetical protein
MENSGVFKNAKPRGGRISATGCYSLADTVEIKFPLNLRNPECEETRGGKGDVYDKCEGKN